MSEHARAADANRACLRCASSGLRAATASRWGGFTLKVRRISFLGRRTGDFDQVTAFVRDVLGMKPSHVEDGWAIFPLELGRRDFLEIYGRANRDERVFPRGSESQIAALATVRPE